MQVIETQDRRLFNQFLSAQEASILQSWEWGEFQKKLGRKVWRLWLSSNIGKVLAAATVVKMPLPRGKCYFYIPRGPALANSPHGQKVWRLLLDKLQDFVTVEKPIFLRIDSPLIAGQGKYLAGLGFEKLSWEVQPKDTLILDLDKSEADLLHQMKPKTRYNIHLAGKKGVFVRSYTDGNKIKIFWDLMKQTAKRDSFSAHPYAYYYNLLEGLGKGNSAELFVAWYHQRPLAAVIVSYFASTATYLHGASSDRFRSVMAPHLLQWTAIKAAREKGMKFYDFGGTAPAGSKNHPWEGITRFKKGFDGTEISYVGAYDLVYQRGWYAIYKLARWLNRMF